MRIPPFYSISPEIQTLITKIEAYRIHFASFPIPKPIKEKIQRVSLLKSSLFSARIEGNPLKLRDIELGVKTESEKKLEIFNILDAITFINAKIKKGNIEKNTILTLHKYVLNNISSDAGHFRKEASAIFNNAGIAVYVPPPPQQIPKLIDKLLLYVNTNKEISPLITANISHLVFEKIHPFLDGNGRVGRLLVAAILKAKGWDISFVIPFEEYLDEHKNEYYFYLDKGFADPNDYLVFMLNAFYQQVREAKEQVDQELAKKDNLFLPPRQEEIYGIIKDHKAVSFDMIRRRFLKVPERTLRYDIKKLLEKGIIEKTGETRGTYYRSLISR